jgi:nitrogenase molybdenum-iron protein alpha chain
LETIAAGYEFAHRDDYEGRRVLPTIKVDADSRNIEEIEVEADPIRYQPRKTPEQLASLAAGGFTFKDYHGMMAQMKKNTLVIDDISHHEIEKLVELGKPDIICSGIKDKFVIEKMGIPSGSFTAMTTADPTPRSPARRISTRRSTGCCTRRFGNSSFRPG